MSCTLCIFDPNRKSNMAASTRSSYLKDRPSTNPRTTVSSEEARARPRPTLFFFFFLLLPSQSSWPKSFILLVVASTWKPCLAACNEPSTADGGCKRQANVCMSQSRNCIPPCNCRIRPPFRAHSFCSTSVHQHVSVRCAQRQMHNASSHWQIDVPLYTLLALSPHSQLSPISKPWPPPHAAPVSYREFKPR